MRNPNIQYNEDGTVVAVAWPGGYPVYYIASDGGILSPEAVQEKLEYCEDPSEEQWYVVDGDINWEDMEMTCEHTNQLIPCAYPEDEVEE